MIMDAARKLLGERSVAEISLRELAAEVGLAKSNVLRYFGSREAVFLDVLDEEWAAWNDRLDAALPAETPPEQVAAILADSLADAPLLCELTSVMIAVLERNVSLDYARDFKRRIMEHSARATQLIRRAVPALSEEDAGQFVTIMLIAVAGLWPCAQPNEVLATVQAELGLPGGPEFFRGTLRDMLLTQLRGLTL
ncbi:TetR/AcrR family transcriptional regulator [Pseudonocardiaceae bacterium YIM PH 21723]|nr:TetR/AcrR family transcriptional regulator [Pseudonocardiaceae bacterium YIM PH 21723]